MNYVLQHLWGLAGHCDSGLRLLSALMGTLTIPALYLLARLWCGRLVSACCALALAISPFQIASSQLVRAYALFGLTTTLSVWAFVWFLRSPTWRRSALWGLCTSALLYTHYFGLFVALTQVLALLCFRPLSTTIVVRSLVTGVGVTAAYLPWLPYLLIRMRLDYISVDVFSLSEVTPHFILTLLNALSGTYSQGFYSSKLATRPWLEAFEPWTLVYLALALAGLMLLTRRSRWAGLLAGMWFLIPASLSILAVHFGQSFLAPRYFTPTSLCLTFLVGVMTGESVRWILMRTQVSGVRGMVLGTVLALAMGLTPVAADLWIYSQERRDGHTRDPSNVAEWIRDRVDPAEPVLFASFGMNPRAQTLAYTLIDYNLDRGAGAAPRLHSYTPGAVALSAKGRTTLDPMVDRVPRTFVSEREFIFTGGDPVAVLLADWLQSNPKFWLIGNPPPKVLQGHTVVDKAKVGKLQFLRFVQK